MKKLIKLLSLITLTAIFASVFASCGLENKNVTTSDDYFIFDLIDVDNGYYSIKAKDISDLPSSIVLPTKHGDGGKVTEIAEKGFQGADITSVYIPSSYEKIGAFAFEGCSKLLRADQSSDRNLEEIGDYAFAGCTKLSAFEFSTATKKLGAYAFYYCSTLRNIYITANIEDIDVQTTFLGCDNADIRVSDANTEFCISKGKLDYIN